jgi:hypothetical protein
VAKTCTKRPKTTGFQQATHQATHLTVVTCVHDCQTSSCRMQREAQQPQKPLITRTQST